MCSVLCSIQHVFLCVCGVLRVAGPGGPPTHVFSIWECVLYVVSSVASTNSSSVLCVLCGLLLVFCPLDVVSCVLKSMVSHKLSRAHVFCFQVCFVFLCAVSFSVCMWLCSVCYMSCPVCCEA